MWNLFPLKNRPEFLELQRTGIYRMLLTLSSQSLSLLTSHAADTTQNLPRGHTQEAAPSPCPAVLASSFSWALRKPRWLWGLDRTLLEWYQCGQHGLIHQDGVTFLFSLRNTSIPPPGYPIFPALLHLFPSESSSSLHSIRHSHQPLLRVWTQSQLPITHCTIYSLRAHWPRV